MNLAARLPPVRGKLIPDAPLAPYTWFRVGGTADMLFMPKDEADLAHFLSSTPLDIPVTVLGVASNTLVRDGPKFKQNREKESGMLWDCL